MTGRLILHLAYGLDIQKKDDPHVTDAEALLRMLTKSSIQGSYLVNSVPALKWVPEWMPGEYLYEFGGVGEGAELTPES